MVSGALPPPAPAPRPLVATRLRDFEPLRPAEQLVLRAVASGAIAKIGYRRPRRDAADLQVRAELLGWLARGGGAGAPIAKRRLQVMGAAVVGRLDLAGAVLPLSPWLYRCTFDTPPQLDGARVHGHLSFADCALPGLQAEGLRTDGDLALNAGTQIDGDVVLRRARVGGHLNCERLQLRSSRTAPHASRQCFDADGVRVAGDVNLGGGVQAVGEVRFVGAQIGGDLRAGGARLTADIDAAGARGAALRLDRIAIGGSLALDAGFSAGGAVRLREARIGGDLDASGAAFDAAGDASWGTDDAALVLDRAQVGGALRLRRLAAPLEGASFVDTRVGTLVDDAATWGRHHLLEGFAWGRFDADAPTDAPMRVGWLLRQRAEPDGTAAFKPEPWQRVIDALRRGGFEASARRVAIGRERHRRAVGAVGRDAPRGLRLVARAAHAGYGAVAGYGHRPGRLVASAALIWLGCAAVYALAAPGFAPSAALLLAAPQLAACRPDCAPWPATLPAFHPLAYSLEVLLPFADLQQQRFWAPARGALAPAVEAALGVAPLRLLTWFEAACGWLLALAALGSAVVGAGIGASGRGRRAD